MKKATFIGVFIAAVPYIIYHLYNSDLYVPYVLYQNIPNIAAVGYVFGVWNTVRSVGKNEPRINFIWAFITTIASLMGLVLVPDSLFVMFFGVMMLGFPYTIFLLLVLLSKSSTKKQKRKK